MAEEDWVKIHKGKGYFSGTGYFRLTFQLLSIQE